MLEVGLIVNPLAGVGGPVALKGSDGDRLQALAASRGAEPRAARRVARTLGELAGRDDIGWHTWGGVMGEEVLRGCGFEPRVLGHPARPTSARDTQLAALAMLRDGVDLLVFAGGDGTAADLLGAVAQRIPVMGIPAGVKMHSGVFATTPEVAAQVLARLAQGGLVRGVRRDVRDRMVEESASEIRPTFIGELLVPELGGFIQQTKEAGRESEVLAVTEISAQICESIRESAAPWVLGPGGTLATIKEDLGMRPTLLGVDVLQQGTQIGADVDARWLEQRMSDAARLVVSFTRGQGFLLGRGNQQLSPTFVRRIGPGAVIVVGTRTKLLTLQGRPLLVDTDDPRLDQTLTGLVEVVAGYDDRLLYRVATHA